MNPLPASLGFLLGKVEQHQENQFLEQLEPFPIDARQFGVLWFIHDNPGSSQKHIADSLMIDRTTMVSHADHLESLRLVKRIRNPDNRRSYILTITEILGG